MADEKLSALTELAATPANDDEVYIRDVSEAAAAESKRITIANLLAGVAVSDTAYAASWNGVTTIAPSKNAVYDKIETISAGKSIATGSYTGDNSASVRQITVGFKCSLVIVIATQTDYMVGIAVPDDNVRVFSNGAQSGSAVALALHATDGFTVSGDGNKHFNRSGVVAKYWAISE